MGVYNFTGGFLPDMAQSDNGVSAIASVGPTLEERAIFASNHDTIGGTGNRQIYSIKIDGSGGLTRLTNDSYDYSHPVVDSAGDNIYFWSNQWGGTYGYIGRMTYDGTGITQVTTVDDAWNIHGLSLSPDNAWIVYGQHTAAANVDVTKIRVNNTDKTVLKNPATGQVQFGQKAWRSDNNKIAYTFSGGGVWEMNTDGTGDTEIYATGTWYYPSYRPDSAYLIAYSTNGTTIGRFQTGTGTFNTPKTGSNLSTPVYNVAGSHIVYLENNEIKIMTEAGGSDTALTSFGVGQTIRGMACANIKV